MRQEAVVLSYLEWTRLIGVGAIRLDANRIFRWRPDRADPTQVVASLMLSAPDLGTSATSFVLAMLEPEVLDQIQEGGTYLGQRLNLDAVRSFHSFSETALAIHKHDAEVAGAAIALTPLAEGWAPWAAAVDAAERRARGEALLAIFEVPPCDRFADATDRLLDRESCIAPDDIVRARDSMFFGWACVLNALKMSTGAAPVLPVEVKDEAEALRRNFDVDQPFLARAPRLRAFVASLAAEGDRSTDLLAMASLKQHERYVIKREGAALAVPSLVDDIRVLEGHEAGAAGLLVQALGERLPAELIQALKARGLTRSVAPSVVVPTSAGDAPRVPVRIDGDEVAPELQQSASKLPEGTTTSLDRPKVPTATSEKTTGVAVVTAGLVADDAMATVQVEALTEPLQEVEAALDPSDHPRSSSAPDNLDSDLGHSATNSEAKSPAVVAASIGPEGRKQGQGKTRRTSKSGTSTPKRKKLKEQEDQPSLLDNT